MDMKSRRHGCELVPESANALETFGFVVLRQFFDPGPLAAEIDKVMANGILRDVPERGDIRFQYVPMMTAQTPVSLSLLDRAETVAAVVFGGPVLPTRAKGTRYYGETPWHTDSDLPLRSVGFLAYLDPVGADSGALRVIPGSHHEQFGEAIRGIGATCLRDPSLPGHVVATEPGDMVLLDERILHASFGGGIRRQWRVDYLSAPAETEVILTKSYFARIYTPNWDGGYDVDRYPSYGPDWRESSRTVVARLERLGVYELATTQEAFMRSRPRH